MENYTIMEFNTVTGKYLTIGYADGHNGEHAKIMFLKSNKYTPPKNTVLHARPPLCR